VTAQFVRLDQLHKPLRNKAGSPALANAVLGRIRVYDALLDLKACTPDRIKVLTDAEATYDGILQALSDWVRDVGTGEKIFLYYSGHGTRVPDLDKDEADGMDDAIVTHDFSKVRPLLDDILHFHFAKIPASASATVVFDCCHSGGLPRSPVGCGEMQDDSGQPRGGPPIPRSEYTPADLRTLAEHKKRFATEETVDDRIVVLAACQCTEQAWEYQVGGRRQGLFTYSLCECLRNGNCSQEAKQVINSAFAAMQTLRPDETQTPRLIGSEQLFQAPLFG
jgi:metacaspase-1